MKNYALKTQITYAPTENNRGTKECMHLDTCITYPYKYNCAKGLSTHFLK